MNIEEVNDPPLAFVKENKELDGDKMMMETSTNVDKSEEKNEKLKNITN